MQTGDGLSRSERSADKPALVLLLLLDRLSRDHDWRDHVDRVREGADPLLVAKAYGNGSKRRRVIAELLLHDAAGRGLARVYTVPSEIQPGADAGNRYSTAFWSLIDEGCDCIVRFGAQRCLLCSNRLPEARLESSGAGARTYRVLYCGVCDPSDGIRRRHRDSAEAVFGQVAQTLRLKLDS